LFGTMALAPGEEAREEGGRDAARGEQSRVDWATLTCGGKGSGMKKLILARRLVCLSGAMALAACGGLATSGGGGSSGNEGASGTGATGGRGSAGAGSSGTTGAAGSAGGGGASGSGSGASSGNTGAGGGRGGGGAAGTTPDAASPDCFLAPDSFCKENRVPTPCWNCESLVYEACASPLPSTCHARDGLLQCMTCNHGIITEYNCTGNPPRTWHLYPQACFTTCSE
jgi:hypothetical protein